MTGLWLSIDTGVDCWQRGEFGVPLTTTILLF